jgi:hypothetical protein
MPTRRRKLFGRNSPHCCADGAVASNCGGRSVEGMSKLSWGFRIYVCEGGWNLLNLSLYSSFAVCQFLSVFFFFFVASRKKIVNFVGFLFRVLQIGSCSAYQWRSHGGGMSRFLLSSSSSAGSIASAS